VNERREQWIEQTNSGQDDTDAVDRDRAHEIDDDDAVAAACQHQRVHERHEVITDEHHVRALTRDIRPRAHRHAHAGLHEGRRVVDTIAHHRDGSAFRQERLDALSLVVREEIGVDRVDTDLLGNDFGDGLAIAGDKESSQAHRFDRGHGGTRLATHNVLHIDRAEEATSPRHENTGRAQCITGGTAGCNPSLAHQCRVSDDDFFTTNRGRDAKPRRVIEGLRRCRMKTTRGRRRQDRFAEWMLRGRLRGSRGFEHLLDANAGRPERSA
jgi:hypothetical protein